jgi:hypothetical protein
MYFYTRNCVSEKITYAYVKIVFTALYSYLIHKCIPVVFGSDCYNLSRRFYWKRS